MRHNEFLQSIAEHAKKELLPLVNQIDQEGLYPEQYMYDLGKIGGFAALGSAAEGGLGYGLDTQIEVIRQVGKYCGATAFSVWCQTACGWYLHKSKRSAVREKYLKDVLTGKLLAGTGMSNTMKHLSKIEKHLLQAKKTDNGYEINGVLPWVSNIAEDHVWAATAQLSPTEFIMFIVDGKKEGVQLRDCPEFCALEGTNTFAVKFKNVLIQEDDLLADANEFHDYIKSIRPGFVLLQVGIGEGIIDGCIQIMAESNQSTEHVNQYLDVTEGEARQNLSKFSEQISDLANLVDEGKATMLPILEARLAASEATLAAAQSAALHAGAKGYLVRHAAQRRTREAMFVAIVTPAIKHLRQDIAALKSA